MIKEKKTMIKLILKKHKSSFESDMLYTVENADYWFRNSIICVYADGNQFYAEIVKFYSKDDFGREDAQWSSTPLKAVNKLLRNYDLKLGMEA